MRKIQLALAGLMVATGVGRAQVVQTVTQVAPNRVEAQYGGYFCVWQMDTPEQVVHYCTKAGVLAAFSIFNFVKGQCYNGSIIGETYNGITYMLCRPLLDSVTVVDWSVISGAVWRNGQLVLQ